jgi:hypothetical protein
MSETDFREHITVLKAKYHAANLKTEQTLDRLDSALWFGEVRPVESDSVLSAYYQTAPAVFQGCFHNCQRLIATTSTDHAVYFEGFVASKGGLLVHHGWLVVDGIVFDPTLEVAAPILSQNGLKVDSRGYFGVPFSPNEVRKNFCFREGRKILLLPDKC